MRRVLLALALLAAAASAAAALAAPADYTIQSDSRIGSFQTKTAPQLAGAEAAFGTPSSVRKLDPMQCRAVWRARGLTMTLLDLNQTGDPCGNGGFVSATTIGKAWHTANGLRVGDPVSRLRRLFPRAALHLHEGPNSGWWLVPRRSCAATGANPYPGLLARTARGRVSAFVVQIGVCE